MLAGKLRAATAGAEGLPIEDLFSTYLYTGNGSTQTITNGIDLAGEGGMVWVKNRSTTATAAIVDTERGASYFISPSETAAQAYNTTANINALNSDGFTVGTGNYTRVNGSGYDYASWTFRKAPRFFDVVTYTGNGVAGRTVSHNLGFVPGMIIIKGYGGTYNGDWAVYHRSLGETKNLRLNTTAGADTRTNYFNDTAPTDTEFTLGTNAALNYNGETYVAYLFAHDPLGPSGDGSDGLIACGSYVGAGTTNRTVTLGWEPQWVLIKKTTTTGNWQVYDNMRGMDYSGQSKYLFPNLSSAEGYIGPASSGGFEIRPTPTGFELAGDASTGGNHLNQTYIYIAIRRGPMRAPTSGTEVFDAHYKSGYTFPTTVDTGFVTDAIFHSGTTTAVKGLNARLTTLSLPTYLATSESSFGTVIFDYSSAQDGFTKSASWGGSGNQLYYSFRRAPGFFDVVAYAGNATVGRTVSHNLGVAPEMMMVKCRTLNGPDWAIYYGDPTDYLKFTNVATADAADYWNDTAPTESAFTLGNKSDVNGSGQLYIAYLFASLDGVSKVGSYTGNGSSQTINCGFTSGARFVLIKRTDSTGDWYVWDTARGIVTGNDPHLSLGDTSAQVTTDDSIDPDSSGFIVNQVAATNINVSSASYIYLAIS